MQRLTEFLRANCLSTLVKQRCYPHSYRGAWASELVSTASVDSHQTTRLSSTLTSIRSFASGPDARGPGAHESLSGRSEPFQTAQGEPENSPARPPLPDDGAAAAPPGAQHWLDRRLPGTREWLQQNSLNWWLHGVEARCK